MNTIDQTSAKAKVGWSVHTWSEIKAMNQTAEELIVLTK